MSDWHEKTHEERVEALLGGMDDQLRRIADALEALPKPTTVTEARAAMRKAFEADMGPGGLWDAYVANVAMLLHDQHGITDHERRNAAARDILRLIFR